MLFSGVSEDCASTLETYESLSQAMPVVLSSIDAHNLVTCPSDDTSAWCDHSDACSGNFGANVPRWTLSRQLACCMGSVSTSHLRATYDAAVKEFVETEVFTAVYAESLDERVSVTTLLQR